LEKLEDLAQQNVVEPRARQPTRGRTLRLLLDGESAQAGDLAPSCCRL